MHDTRIMCIIRPCRVWRSSVRPGTPVRRRSTACSRIRHSSSYALGSDSLAGEPAGNARSPPRPQRLEPHPAVHHERRGARCRRRRHVPVSLPRGGSSARRPVARAWSSTSPEPTGSSMPASTATGTGSSTRIPTRSRLVVVRASRAASRRPAGSSRTPAATRPPRCSRSRRSLRDRARPVSSSTRSRG